MALLMPVHGTRTQTCQLELASCWHYPAPLRVPAADPDADPYRACPPCWRQHVLEPAIHNPPGDHT